MRVTQLLTTTLREAPRDVESGSHELLVRGGFVRQLTAGIYSILPPGQRVIHKIVQIVREEMEHAGGQEVLLPVLQPRELWERHGEDTPSRAETMHDVLFSLKDHKGREFVLGPTHEEIATLLASEFVRSYRDLPRLVYQIQTKLRDEARPRAGLLRTREFLMKDLYSFDADQAGLESSYRRMERAYRNIFTRCGLHFVVAQADSGAIGGQESHEFLALTEAGEDEALICEQCGYAANRERAEFVRSEYPREPEGALEAVYTPGVMTIYDLATFLNVPTSKTMKVVCYVASGRLVIAAIRGDLEINEVKLTGLLYQRRVNASDLHLATPEELAQEGIIAGYTSPLDKGSAILIVADHSLQIGNNFVAGANKANYHLINVNYPRDFRVDAWADIASAADGAQCIHCGGTLQAVRGIEIGHIFKPGARYSALFDAAYLDAAGVSHPLLMGTYGLGITRTMATIVEQHHDDKGIIWPLSVAPYQVALVGLDLEKEETREAAEKLYADLLAAGVEVLFDDRPETAGVKFNDADLIGLPLRAVVSKRSLKNGGVELKQRSQRESRMLPLAGAVEGIRDEIQRASTALTASSGHAAS